MSYVPYQKLKSIQKVLYVTLALLLFATAASVLSSVLNYVIVVVIALAILAFHWFTKDHVKAQVWRKYLAMALPVFTILAPLIYIFMMLFVYNDSVKWLQFARFCTIILPMLLLMYSIRSLQKIIDQL